MCLLCGGFVAASHWTDRYVEDEARYRGADDGGYTRERRRDRAHGAALAKKVLKHCGLGVEDWGGSKYVFTNGKGASELVGDLGSPWPAATRPAGPSTLSTPSFGDASSRQRPLEHETAGRRDREGRPEPRGHPGSRRLFRGCGSLTRTAVWKIREDAIVGAETETTWSGEKRALDYPEANEGYTFVGKRGA